VTASTQLPDLPAPPRTSFASDNAAGAHPAVLAAISAANDGPALAYGADPHTAECEERFRALFGADVTTRLVFNGTGANIVALATLLGSLPGPHHAVVCTDMAHIAVDETGAPDDWAWAAVNPDPLTDPPTIYYDQAGGTVFPSVSVMPLQRLRVVILEWVRTGRRPETMDWLPINALVWTLTADGHVRVPG